MFEQTIQHAKEEIAALLAGERTDEQEPALCTALRIAATSQRTSTAAQGPEPVSRKERAVYNDQVKPIEEQGLSIWAQSVGLWMQEADFMRRYGASFIDAGAEQKVYLAETGTNVHKANTGNFHGTWLEFFIRLILHKAIFPSTAYSLLGFTNEDNRFCVLIEQAWAAAKRGATRPEVNAYLQQIGFVNTRHDDYYNPTHGLVLEDLHDENVFVGIEDNLLFVDPVLYLEAPDMRLGGTSLFRFPFA